MDVAELHVLADMVRIVLVVFADCCGDLVLAETALPDDLVDEQSTLPPTCRTASTRELSAIGLRPPRMITRSTTGTRLPRTLAMPSSHALRPARRSARPSKDFVDLGDAAHEVAVADAEADAAPQAGSRSAQARLRRARGCAARRQPGFRRAWRTSRPFMAPTSSSDAGHPCRRLHRVKELLPGKRALSHVRMAASLAPRTNGNPGQTFST
jgi:hypothetical protein